MRCSTGIDTRVQGRAWEWHRQKPRKAPRAPCKESLSFWWPWKHGPVARVRD
jgi:hypothetical protein